MDFLDKQYELITVKTPCRLTSTHENVSPSHSTSKYKKVPEFTDLRPKKETNMDSNLEHSELSQDMIQMSIDRRTINSEGPRLRKEMEKMQQVSNNPFINKSN